MIPNIDIIELHFVNYLSGVNSVANLLNRHYVTLRILRTGCLKQGQIIKYYRKEKDWNNMFNT